MSIFRINHDPNKPASDPSQNKYLTGENAGFVFESDADVLAAMSTNEYHTNPDYRYAVHVVLGRSPGILMQGDNRKGLLESAMANRQQAAAAEEREIFNEKTLELFGSDLYKKSPTERKRVRELIAANSGEIEAAAPERFINRAAQAVRIQATEADMQAVRQTVAKEKEANRQAIAKDAAQRAYDRAMNGEVGSDDESDE